jgi:hypothetical protein
MSGRYLEDFAVRCAAIGLLLAPSASEIRSQPLPPRRPPELGPEKPAQRSEGGEAGQFEIGACLARVAALGIEFQTAAAPSDDKACAVAMPIRLERLVVRHGAGGSINFPARPLIDCRLAEPLALWIGGVIAPVFAASFSSALKAVRTGPGFECRNRNHEAAGKASAHATGFALDISGFELASGQVVSFGSGGDAALRTVRTAACGWFTTVLGPGSDTAHEDHLHVDIQQHGTDGRYRICE